MMSRLGEHSMKEKNGRMLSRREFAQRAALLSATATLGSAQTVFPSPTSGASPQAATSGLKLSEAGQAEADSRYQQIVALYGSRFDDAQKADAPALYLKPLVEREKKSQAAATPASTHS